MVYACNSSTQEDEFEASLGYKDLVFKKKKKKV
jgi:hypothetical protein